MTSHFPYSPRVNGLQITFLTVLGLMNYRVLTLLPLMLSVIQWIHVCLPLCCIPHNSLECICVEQTYCLFWPHNIPFSGSIVSHFTHICLCILHLFCKFRPPILIGLAHHTGQIFTIILHTEID